MTLADSLRSEAAALDERADRLRALAAELDASEGGEVAPLEAREPGEFFTWAELTVTSTGLPNKPDPTQAAALTELCRVILDPLRRRLGKPIRVTSGFRSPEVNAAVDGAAKSQHVKGQAADIVVVGMTSTEVARVVEELLLPFDQMIGYANKPHLHLSYKANPRRQTLFHEGGVYSGWSP